MQKIDFATKYMLDGTTTAGIVDSFIGKEIFRGKISGGRAS